MLGLFDSKESAHAYWLREGSQMPFMEEASAAFARRPFWRPLSRGHDAVVPALAGLPASHAPEPGAAVGRLGPVLLVIGAAVLLREKVSRAAWLGIALISAAVVLVSLMKRSPLENAVFRPFLADFPQWSPWSQWSPVQSTQSTEPLEARSGKLVEADPGCWASFDSSTAAFAKSARGRAAHGLG